MHIPLCKQISLMLMHPTTHSAKKIIFPRKKIDHTGQ